MHLACFYFIDEGFMNKLCVFIAGIFLSLNVFAAVDLNAANQAQLESVNGIGPAKAKAIIDYRTKNGAFKTLDDLDKVSGFGKATITKVKAELVVGGGKVAASPTAPAAVAATPAKAAAAVKPLKK